MSLLRQDEGSASGGAEEPLRTFRSPGYAMCDSRFQFVGNGMTSTSCFSQHQSRRSGHSRAVTRPSVTLGCSVVPPREAFYHRRCLIAKNWTCVTEAVSGTAGTEHEVAHTRPVVTMTAGKRQKTHSPSPSASQRLNEAAACLSAL